MFKLEILQWEVFYYLPIKINEQNIKKSLDIFERKKQRILEKRNFSNYTLITFSKRSINHDNFFQFDNENFIASIGTPIYNILNGKDAASELYADFKKNSEINFAQFNGHFSYIIFIDNKLYLFNDFNGIYHVYHDLNYDIISNSFLAVLVF